jgi:hypothetical protein
MSKFTHSTQMEKLATGRQARAERVVRALGFCGGTFRSAAYLTPTKQASATVAHFASGLDVLISYYSAVAYRLPDGSFVQTPRNQYSRTTDRSVAEFVRGEAVTLEPQAFREALARHLMS